MERTVAFRVASILMAFVAATACGGGQQTAEQPRTEPSKAAVAQPEAPATAPAAGEARAAPVELSFVGLDAPKMVFRYRVKINTDKPVTQVDISAKYVGADGKALDEMTHAWQNIVKMERQPIEMGKTYDAEGYLFPDTARVECKLQRVIYGDGTRWSAPQ